MTATGVTNDPDPHCMDCVDLGHLEFLPGGDTALTDARRRPAGCRPSSFGGAGHARHELRPAADVLGCRDVDVQNMLQNQQTLQMGPGRRILGWPASTHRVACAHLPARRRRLVPGRAERLAVAYPRVRRVSLRCTSPGRRDLHGRIETTCDQVVEVDAAAGAAGIAARQAVA
jgi:hypothetical protein